MTKTLPAKDPSRAREDAATPTQAAPTQLPKRSQEGHELAEDGLPKSGPARLRAIAAQAAEVTEKSNG